MAASRGQVEKVLPRVRRAPEAGRRTVLTRRAFILPGLRSGRVRVWCEVRGVRGSACYRSTAYPVTRPVATRLDSFALLQSVYALESSLHSALARVIQIRRALESFPDRGAHCLDLEQIVAAAGHVAKASSQLQRFPLPRP